MRSGQRLGAGPCDQARRDARDPALHPGTQRKCARGARGSWGAGLLALARADAGGGPCPGACGRRAVRAGRLWPCACHDQRALRLAGGRPLHPRLPPLRATPKARLAAGQGRPAAARPHRPAGTQPHLRRAPPGRHAAGRRAAVCGRDPAHGRLHAAGRVRGRPCRASRRARSQGVILWQEACPRMAGATSGHLFSGIG